MRINNRSQKKGNAYIEVAYEHLLKHGSATSEQLVEVTGSNPQMFGSGQCLRMNEYMHMVGKPHRFRVAPGTGGRGGYPPSWTIREVKVRA